LNPTRAARHQGVEDRMTNPTSNTAVSLQRAGRITLALLALALRAAPSPAADAVERPYDPPVGSHWVIDSESTSDDQRPEGPRHQLIKTHAEMTIEEKTADGFRISYVSRGASFEGNTPMLPVMRSAFRALENVTIHATTDLSGKPIRVDNLDEAKTAMRNMVGGMLAPFQDKPQVAAVLSQMMSRMIDVDATQAASVYLEELPMLARAQNTGMKSGETRHSSEAVPNPLGGGALKSNSTFELTDADAGTGKRTYLRTTAYDDASMKDMTQSVSKKLLAASGDAARAEQIEKLVKSMALSLDERATFEVEDGMTRRISKKSVTQVSAMGHTLIKTETRTITVARAP
jgi:hypothetical protein